MRLVIITISYIKNEEQASDWSARVLDSSTILVVTWRDLIGQHSWLQQYNSCIGMTPDPSSLVKGLACQTNTHSGKLCLRPGTSLWLAWAATPQLGISYSNLF